MLKCIGWLIQTKTNITRRHKIIERLSFCTEYISRVFIDVKLNPNYKKLTLGSNMSTIESYVL